MRKNSLILAASCGLTLLFARCNTGGLSNFAFLPLEFPFSSAGDIVRIAAYGIPNWSGSEPHNGIDLVVDEHLTSVRITSPTAGKVTAISTQENPYSEPSGQLLVTIAIRINNEWIVYLVLEPGTVDPTLKTAQLAAILVSEGQDVEVGTPVADLMIGTLGYPHLHYMVEHNGEAVCAYAHSSDAAKATFVSLSDLPGSNLPDGNICYGQP
ncbi:MAG: M23 family metallopeptidase [Planctomycetota bacterium]|nr:M23 family metallopeptidase [Planctomycetota bacterium]